MAAVNPVKIKDWDLKESQKAPNPQVFRHLDLGSANYRPGNRPQSVDSKTYRVLFSNVDRIIAEHPGYKKFTFYLNDLSSEGLDRAATCLAQHLEQEHQEIKAKIVKIVKNFFEIDPIPSVNSASLLNPDLGELFGAIALYVHLNELEQDRQVIPSWKTPAFITNGKKIVRLFQRVAATSQEGFLVREIDVGSDMAKRIHKRLSASGGIAMVGLHFTDAEEKTKSIPSYISSRDTDFFAIDPNRGSITYLVTRAFKSLEDLESYSDLPVDLTDLFPLQDEASARTARRLAALRTELEKARQGVASEPPHNDASRLATLETEFKIAEQECEGYETEGRWAGVSGNPNLVLIRDQSGEEKMVEGKLIETVGQIARDEQGEIIPNRVIIHDNQVHDGEVLVYANGAPQRDFHDRLRVRLFDRVLVWGTAQRSNAASQKVTFLIGNALEQQAMEEASAVAYQHHITARQRVADLKKGLISLRRAAIARKQVADLEKQIAQLEQEERSRKG